MHRVVSFRIWFALLAMLLVLTSCTSYEFKGATIEPPDMATEFTLINQDGQPFRLTDQRGKVVVIFFGYTNCPDICPATMSDMQVVMNRLGDQRDQLKVVFITVDPDRDTSERLQRFIGMFDSDIVGLTGDAETLNAVYKAYGAGATRRDLPDSALGYAMDHTATSTVIDKQGQRRLLFGFGTPVDDMFSDLSALINE
jgi:protein SCO1/2